MPGRAWWSSDGRWSSEYVCVKTAYRDKGDLIFEICEVTFVIGIKTEQE